VSFVMNENERMIWAAAFVAYRFDRREAPLHVHREKQDNRGALADWERGRDASAIEYATYAVLGARGARARVEEGWGAGDKVYQALGVMLDGHGPEIVALREALVESQRAFVAGLKLRDEEIERLRAENQRLKEGK
jgi:hypothetical protein